MSVSRSSCISGKYQSVQSMGMFIKTAYMNFNAAGDVYLKQVLHNTGCRLLPRAFFFLPLFFLFCVQIFFFLIL